MTDQRKKVSFFTARALITVAIFATLVTTTRQNGAHADPSRLQSSRTRSPGQMTVTTDEFGGFGTHIGRTSFRYDEQRPNGSWMYFSGLMVTNGSDFQWLVNEPFWRHQYDRSGRMETFEGLTSDDVEFDHLDEDGTTRRTRFSLDVQDLDVELVQQTPTAAYNFIQSYQFTNTGSTPISANLVWFGDADLSMTSDFKDDHLGIASLDNPRLYFIEPADLGEGDPGLEDRQQRISVASAMSDGIDFDGYLAVQEAVGSASGPFPLYIYLQDYAGIWQPDLNSFLDMSVNFSFDDLVVGSNNDIDVDEDQITDRPGDVAAAMQFALDLGVGESATLTLDFIGGSLSNAATDLRTGRSTLLGDCDDNGLVDAADIQCGVAMHWLPEVMFAETELVQGDLNADGSVDFADFLTLSNNYGKEDAHYVDGDLNFSGQIGFDDFLLLSSRIELGSNAGALSVPEPTSSILGLALFICTSRRWSRRRRPLLGADVQCA